MNYELLGTFLCGAGIVQSLFLSLYFFAAKKFKKQDRILLGLLFLLVTIRLVKSIGWYFFGVENDVFLNLGFLAHVFLGPVLLQFLIKQIPSLTLDWKMIAGLYILPLLLVPVIPFLTLQDFWYQGGYMGLLYLTMLYLVVGIFLLRRIYRENTEASSFSNALFAAIGLFCILYFTNYILGIHQYITGPILYALVIYAISYYIFRNKDLLGNVSKSKYQNINISPEQLLQYSEIIKKVMLEERPYLNGDFNLGMLAKKTKTPKHILSSIFSTTFKQSFPEFTNAYRIEEAMRLLRDDSYRNKKIESIAYDSGFNSVSAFNYSFKKRNNCSPSEFRKLEFSKSAV